MIISHRHRFIFIKNRKVGSTSVELALQPICGPEDVLTPDNLHSGEKDVLAAQARNWQGRFLPVRELMHCRYPIEAARVLRDAATRPKFYNHMRASSVKARVPAAVWDGYYKFCFDRNPWDKAVSFYYWRGRSRPMPEFNDYIVNWRDHGTLDQALPSDWTRYTLHDRLVVDDVFDFADLAGGLATALSRAGVPADIVARVTLGAEKTATRKEATVRFREEADAVIRRAFAREIASFDFCRRPPPGFVANTDTDS